MQVTNSLYINESLRHKYSIYIRINSTVRTSAILQVDEESIQSGTMKSRSILSFCFDTTQY